MLVTIGGAVGHNKPLKHRRPKWKSDVRLTEAQLQQKRDEFWDTAPAFDGRAEIWDALKASVQALESADHQLAQAILDGAGISLPNGTVSLFLHCSFCGCRTVGNAWLVDVMVSVLGLRSRTHG